MNKLCLTITLLMVSPRPYASGIPPQQQDTTAVCFKSTTGQAHTIGIAASDSIGIVYNKVARTFCWKAHYIIYCCGNRTCIPLTLDITNIFFGKVKSLSQDGQLLIVTPDPNVVSLLLKPNTRKKP